MERLDLAPLIVTELDRQDFYPVVLALATLPCNLAAEAACRVCFGLMDR